MQSLTFLSKEQYRHNSQTIYQTASHAQVTSSANFYENTNPEIEPFNTFQPNEIQEIIDFIKQIEETIGTLPS